MFQFAGLELDTARRVLSRDGQELQVQPQVFDLLALLVANSDRMLSKEELLDTVWGDRFVSESALSSRIKSARQAVGDNGRDQNVIRTVHGRGFALVAEVTTVDQQERPAPTGDVHSAPIDASKSNLPRRRSRLIGRENEIALASELLSRRDLVSIVGPGGVGKTSLSIEVAHRARASYPGGVWMCELAPVADSHLGSAIIGSITGGSGSKLSSVPDVVALVSSEPTLLVLDNCEHVVDAVAEFVDELVELCPELSILTTSREALNVRGEQVLRLEGLDHRGPSDAAIDLFFERANEVSELSEDSETRATVVDIVTRLEGLPLAIELAAPRLISMTPRDLLAALNDQLAILAARRRNDDRQSAMDRAISWSYDLLTDEERSTLQELGIFAGAFSIEAASAVASTPILSQVLHRLVEQSMVTRVERGHVTRYRLLEPTRQFVEREIDAESLRVITARHAEYFCEHVTAIAGDLWTDAEATAADTLTAEWADISRAVAWARSERLFEMALRPLAELGVHMMWQHRHEALEWLDDLLEQSEGAVSDELLPEVMLLSSLRAFSMSDQPGARSKLEAAQQRFGPSVLSGLMGCFVEIIGSDFERLASAGNDFWELAVEDGDQGWIGVAAAFRLIGRALADPNDAEIESLVGVVDQYIGGPVESAVTCFGLLSHLTLEVRRGDGEKALFFHTELRRATIECRAPWFAQVGGGLIAQSTVERNDPVEYLTPVVDSVRGTVRMKELSHYGLVFRAAVVALEEVGEPMAAAQVVGLLAQVHDVGAIRRTLNSGYNESVQRLGETLGGPEYERLTSIGRRLSPLEGLALCETALEAVEAKATEANQSPGPGLRAKNE